MTLSIFSDMHLKCTVLLFWDNRQNIFWAHFAKPLAKRCKHCQHVTVPKRINKNTINLH